jgi:replicative DNA helicase
MSVSYQPRQQDVQQDQLLPQNLDAERGVLGAILYDNDLINDVIIRVDADDFFRVAHQVVYKTICDIYNSGSSVDCVVLADELKHQGVFHKIGGVDLLSELADGDIHRLNARQYASIVHQRAISRKLIEAGNEIVRDGYSGLYTSNQLIEQAERKVFAVAERRATANTVGMTEVVGGVMERIRKAKEGGEIFGMSTGLLDLDDKIGGFRPGQLIILAARPGNGKTAVAMNMALNRAEKQVSTLFVSLEMEHEELGFRMLSSKASVDSRKLLNNDPFVAGEAQRVAVAGVEIEKARLYIDDSPGQSLAKLAANARRRKQRDNLEFLVIDYLGLINETATRNQNTVDVMTKISNGLKNLAKELKIPILALHQLNRDSEKEQRRPRKSDLRSSGSIEQDADIILLLHTEMSEDDVAGPVEMIVAKNRSGRTGKVDFWFNKPFNRFEAMALQGQIRAADIPNDPYDNNHDRPF